MSSASRQYRWRKSALVLDTLRLHRVSATVWVVAGSIAMYVMAASLASEMRRYPGGAKAFAQSLQAGVEAIRPIRWPADRLDTLGGYLTYHNVTLFTFFLAIYGAMQGARAIRGDEDKHSLEEILATGWSRTAVIRDRVLGFLILMALISLGLGLGVAASVAGGDEPNLGGSLITMMAAGLCAMVGYSLGMLVAQVTSSTTVAAGIASLILTVIYVATNMWDKVVGFISPFHYANESRALIPGFGLDISATLVLIAMSAVLLTLATTAFVRRDYRSPLWVRKPKQVQVQTSPARVQRPMLRTIWTSILLRGRIGLLSWVLSVGAYLALMASLQPAVMKAWKSFDFLGAMSGGVGKTSIATQYISLSSDFITPMIAAFMITQAAKWVADLEQGRVEIVLATPVSWSRLVWERLLAAVFGVIAITAGGLAGLAIGTVSVGAKLNAAGLARQAIGNALIAAALGAIAAIVVAAFRSSIAVTILSVFVGASYLIGLLVPVFNWPDWLNRISIFYALGHPYLAWPAFGNWGILLAFAIPGALLAAFIAERTPKVA